MSIDKKIKALCLFSGGLDSVVAAKLVKDQGIECIAINFTAPFIVSTGTDDDNPIKKAAEEIGIEYRRIPLDDDFIDVIRNPGHGHGKGLNPCVDCKIYMIRYAGRLMKKFGAGFLVTGEVLGQRPMSQQRKSMNLIENQSGLEGLILRPLSARHFDETIPEKNGWVDRTKLLSVNGRGRNIQLEYAKKWGIKSYGSPAGGCLLTEKLFAVKLKDLFDNKMDADYKDMGLLRIGRHFRFGKNKIVVGRNKQENDLLKSYRSDDESIFEVLACGSPATLLQGEVNDKSLEFAAGLTAMYSDDKSERVKVNYGKDELDNEIFAGKMDMEYTKQFNLAFKKLGNKKIIVDDR